MPNGMPTMVTKQASAEAMWPMASQTPMSTNQRMLPISPRAPAADHRSGPSCILRFTARLPNGKKVKVPMTKQARPQGIPMGDEAEQPRQPPGQPHEDASQHEPEQIEQEAEKGHTWVTPAAQIGCQHRSPGTMAQARRWTFGVAARHFVPDWRRMAIKKMARSP